MGITFSHAGVDIRMSDEYFVGYIFGAVTVLITEIITLLIMAANGLL